MLRPHGPNAAAHFMIIPPPLTPPVSNHLRFAIMLYGNLANALPALLSALLEQQHSGLHGHHIQIQQACSAHPGGEALPLMAHGQRLAYPEGQPPRLDLQTAVAHIQAASGPTAHYRLSFRSPLLLASRKAQREPERLSNGLPWPSLGAILDSIADRLRAMEPDLANGLGLTADWRAPEHTRGIEALTPAANPAQQVAWAYTSTPRDGEASTPPTRRTLPIFGIVGDLIYPATGLTHEHQLLYWGQWLGVGQKTTMGCGSYALVPQ
jgi:hypothetical protein